MIVRDEAEPAAGTALTTTPAPWTQRRNWLALGLLVLAGAIFYFPALHSPFLLDDYFHASMIDGTFPVHRSPFDLYNFVNDADRRILIERGLLPWWSDPHLVIRFFRPLSSALLWADHRLLGNNPIALHIHSFLWWIAAMLSARALFRRLFSVRVAWTATVIFALAPCHAIPLAWLANREALVSLTFGVLGLTSYLSWREQRAWLDGAFAAALFGLSLLGGEYGLSLAGYILAFEIVRHHETLSRRAVGLLAFIVPVGAYLVARSARHYGAVGSGVYSDPIHEPAAFLRAAPRRLVTLLADAWLSLDNETLTSSTPGWALAIGAVVVIAILFVPLRSTLARLRANEFRAASFLILGSVLALAPVLAVVPSPRLLGASLLGVAPIVALLLDRAWFPEKIEPRHGYAELTGLVALLLGFAHLVHAPVTSWLVSRQFRQSAAIFAEHAAELRARLDDPANADVVIMRSMGGAFFLPLALNRHGAPPARWRILAHTGHALALRRGPRTLDIVVPPDQSIFPSGPGNIFRNDESKVSAGDVFDVPGLHVTVLEVGDSGPRSVRYEFDRDLDAAPLVWISERFDGFPDAAPPKVGFGASFDP
ncbi:MAG: hypothetical protein ABJE95_00805 [Byssovorax sp.]